MNDNKKIGILTFYHTINYGALLQMYALYKYVKTLGGSAEIIRYHCESVEKQENISLRDATSLKKLIRYCLLKRPNSKKQKYFREFENSVFLFSDRIYDKDTISEAAKEYETIIVGSDQVWNLKLTNGDRGFFLENVEGLKKCSYAASFGSENLPADEAAIVAPLLNDFSNITVRETSGQKIVDSAIRKSPELVLDPTFLLNADEWRFVAGENSRKDKPYIVLYLIQNKKLTINYAKKMANKYGWGIKYINISPYHVNGVDNIRSADPKEFLQILDNAKLVITGSYHGLALSINFSKPVYYELNSGLKNYNTRISSLISVLGMEACRLDYSKLDMPPIQYDSVQKKLTVLRKKSKKALSDIVNL